MSNNQDYIIACHNLQKVYGEGRASVKVLHDVNFAIKPSEKVAIIGRSGSGKTTLVNLLGGLEIPTDGKILLHSQNISLLSDKARGHLRNKVLGFIFQFHHLLSEFTALENVCMPLLIRGVSAKEAKARAANVLDQVELNHRYEHKPNKLSGGEKQRVAIARALVTEPKCVLADEPTGNLDQESADHVYDLMVNLTQKVGTSFIVVTHDNQLASRMDRIVKLEKGELVTVAS